MGDKNIRENQGEMSIISLRIFWKTREFFLEIVVATPSSEEYPFCSAPVI